MQKEASETVQSLLRKPLLPRNTKVYLTSEKRRRKQYSTEKWIKDISLT